jgi:hypothetical protein
LSGVLGLSQNQQLMKSPDAIDVAPLFVDRLKKSGGIKSARFSFAMSEQSETSYIDFGNPNYSRVKGEKNSIGIPPTITLGCNDDFFWSNNL